MNCENCKNKHATVFYADEGGGRHALCQACAQTLQKVAPYSPASDGGSISPFIPAPTLSSLKLQSPQTIYCRRDDDRGRAICPYCATTLESICEKGRAGCPECYTVFGDALFPSSRTPESAPGARMPSTRRALIDRLRSIAELKTQIRIAVESENYELAATLRDKIRKLEGARRA